jgi:hypothetical protein
VKNTQQWCEKNLINNINLIIHYNHIESLPKEVCDGVMEPHVVAFQNICKSMYVFWHTRECLLCDHIIYVFLSVCIEIHIFWNP